MLNLISAGRFARSFGLLLLLLAALSLPVLAAESDADAPGAETPDVTQTEGAAETPDPEEGVTDDNEGGETSPAEPPLDISPSGEELEPDALDDGTFETAPPSSSDDDGGGGGATSFEEEPPADDVSGEPDPTAEELPAVDDLEFKQLVLFLLAVIPGVMLGFILLYRVG